MKIVLLESLGISNEKLELFGAVLRSQGHVFEAYEKDTNLQIQIKRVEDADVIIIANMPLRGEVIRSCKKLKFINIAFTGVDHVDLEAAKAVGAVVSNASGYSNESVAELVVCMTLSLLRKISQVEQRCREGQTKEGLVGSELKGKTIGIVGTGVIGSRTAQLFHAFDCKILAYDPYQKEDNKDILTYVSLEELIRQSDIITLHCPLNESTHHLIQEEHISMMKRDAILIDAARGPVVDYEALAKALREGKLGGAGIDVFETEPPLNLDHPMLHTPNTMVTPHVAFASKESMELRAEIVFQNIDHWLSGNQSNVVL